MLALLCLCLLKCLWQCLSPHLLRCLLHHYPFISLHIVRATSRERTLCLTLCHSHRSLPEYSLRISWTSALRTTAHEGTYAVEGCVEACLATSERTWGSGVGEGVRVVLREESVGLGLERLLRWGDITSIGARTSSCEADEILWAAGRLSCSGTGVAGTSDSGVATVYRKGVFSRTAARLGLFDSGVRELLFAAALGLWNFCLRIVCDRDGVCGALIGTCACLIRGLLRDGVAFRCD